MDEGVRYVDRLRFGQTRRCRVPRARRPWCTVCATDRYLTLESVQALGPPTASLLEAAYTCSACRHFYVHAVTVAQAGLITDHLPLVIDVLQIDGVYFHCGEPLPTVEYGHRSIYGPASTEHSPEVDPQAVSLRVKLLRCSRGFQMEIPD